MIDFLKGQFFANICLGITAIVAIITLIGKLRFRYRENKAKYDMSIQSVYPYVYKKLYEGKYINKDLLSKKFYGISIINRTLNENIRLKQFIVVKPSILKKRTFQTNKEEWTEIYLPPDILKPNMEYTFPIEKDTINNIFKKNNKKKITIYFTDKINKKYKTQFNQKDFEEIDKNDLILEQNLQ